MTAGLTPMRMNERRLSASFFPWIFAVLMGGTMTAIITAILFLVTNVEWTQFPVRWVGNWLLAWVIAIPVIVVVAPRARVLASRIAVPPAVPQRREADRHAPIKPAHKVVGADLSKKQSPSDSAVSSCASSSSQSQTRKP